MRKLTIDLDKFNDKLDENLRSIVVCNGIVTLDSLKREVSNSLEESQHSEDDVEK